jgi:N6-adenosine-specific RNA methylase IME4
MLTEVLAAWGMRMTEEWVWAKVTAAGEPIGSLWGKWRRPWEVLVVARRKDNVPAGEVKRRVLVAVPDLHSRKPGLRGESMCLGHEGRDVRLIRCAGRDL